VDRHHIDADADPDPIFLLGAVPDLDPDLDPTPRFTQVGKSGNLRHRHRCQNVRYFGQYICTLKFSGKSIVYLHI
jgi:hypothetical protein